MLLERDKKAQNISDIWQGSNLTVEGLQQVLKSLGTKTDKKKHEIPVEEVSNDWERLASWAATGQRG